MAVRTKAKARQPEIMINAFIYDGFKINTAKVSSIEMKQKHRLVFVSIAIIADSYCIVHNFIGISISLNFSIFAVIFHS